MYICSIFRLFLTFNIIIKINDQRLHVAITEIKIILIN